MICVDIYDKWPLTLWHILSYPPILMVWSLNAFAQCIIACITFWNFSVIVDCWSVIYIACLICLCFVLLQCSVSCGEGEIVRQVICFNYNHQRTSDHQCNAAIRPDTTRSCQAADCPVETSVNSNVMNKSNSAAESDPSSDWRTGPWTQVQTLRLVHWCIRWIERCYLL